MPKPTPIANVRTTVRFISVAASGGTPACATARIASGTSNKNNSKPAATNNANKLRTTDNATKFGLTARANADAKSATSPIVGNGNEASVVATVPNSHSGDLKWAGYQCNRISIPPITASNKPKCPNIRHAVLGADTAIGSIARVSAWISTCGGVIGTDSRAKCAIPQLSLMVRDVKTHVLGPDALQGSCRLINRTPGFASPWI